MSENQWTEKVPQRKRQKVNPRVRGRHVVKTREDQRVGEKHGIVEEGLRNHEQQAQYGTAWVGR